jgi:hypothetical protein
MAEFQYTAMGVPAASKLDSAATSVGEIRSTVEKYYELYTQSASAVAQMAKTAAAQIARPAAIYDARITGRLGSPRSTVNSGNIRLQLFNLNGGDYNGYALKVDLKSSKAMRMVLGKDAVGGSETTLSAASRYGAVAGVNAGGFADDNKTGKRYPLSTTILGGKYVYGFEPTFDNLTFVGFTASRKMIGGKFSRQSDLDKLQPDFGATFVPALLQQGKRQTIPDQWLNSPRRAPRTVVANYKDGQLLFLVTDGYDERGNSGATLPELQDKLVSLGAIDAYNLDGGGSSSLVFNGQVINKPSDGKLRPLPTHFLFFK